MKAYLRLKAPVYDLQAIKLRLKAVGECGLRNDALYFIAGKQNSGKGVVLKPDVFDVIAHMHGTLRHGMNQSMLRSVGNIMELITMPMKHVFYSTYYICRGTSRSCI